ncbi:hypothetical protein [Salinibacter altiplanensis]|uniref:hypothetical protein n=1 Tax=Salinibacter altiplanensis TaxID=1803181 RepID=UPI00131A4DB4|nr:hypothetical protein [Salinibacter altiplanensis]
MDRLSITLVFTNRRLHLSKVNAERVENVLRPTRRDALVLVLIVLGYLLDGHIELVGKPAQGPALHDTRPDEPPPNPAQVVKAR